MQLLLPSSVRSFDCTFLPVTAAKGVDQFIPVARPAKDILVFLLLVGFAVTIRIPEGA
jgi:hypothetical protein